MDNYYISKNSNSAMILCLGSGGSNYLTKKVAKWFVKNGINVLAVGPKGKDIPYEKYTYQHPDYWQTVMKETKGSGNMLVATKIYEETEKQNPLLEEMMIPIENIKGKLLLVGCEDDCLWPTVKYIKRMQQRMNDKKDSKCDLEALVYKYGTHYAFPESMLKSILPICSDKLIGLAFVAAKQHPQQCKENRIDIDKHFKEVIDKWKVGGYISHEI